MHKITLPLILGAVALAVPTAVLAKDRSAPKGDLTRATVQARAVESFRELDANGDGTLDAADRETQQKARFDRLDSDKNGELSFEEMKAMRGQRPDGARGERKERPPIAMRGPGMPGPGMRAPGGMRGPGMRGPGMGPRGFAAEPDIEQDRALTQAEFETAMLARFDEVDSDSDGTVTAAERSAHRATMRDQMKAKREEMREQMKARRAERAG